MAGRPASRGKTSGPVGQGGWRPPAVPTEVLSVRQIHVDKRGGRKALWDAHS